jgi:hypothetical protein
MLMMVSVAVLASASASPRHGNHDSAGLFGRKTARTACPVGQRYSSFYKECVHGWTQASVR